MGMRSMFNASVVGLGRTGSEFDDDPKRKFIWSHSGAYNNVERTNLLALCDLDKDKLEKCGEKWGVNKLYTDHNEMLKKEDIDILSICTWNSTHLPILKSAVKNGVKAIYCEKPISVNIKEADEMIKLCRENNVILLVNHWRRFDGFHPKIKEFIDSGKLGELQQASFYYTAGIANSGSHMFDLMRYLFGNIDWIEGYYKTKKEDPDIDGVVKFKNGMVCTVQSLSDDYYKRFNLFIYGGKGAIEITRAGFDLDMYEVRQSDKWSEYKELYKMKSLIEYKEESCFVNGVNHLVDCLEQNKSPVSTGEDARESLASICAFHESAMQDGKRIYFPLKETNIEIKSR